MRATKGGREGNEERKEETGRDRKTANIYGAPSTCQAHTGTLYYHRGVNNATLAQVLT